MLSKKNRLKKKKDFEAVFKTGRKHPLDFFILRIKQTSNDFNRFGIIVSKKVSKSAVKRNKIKRIISRILRENNEKMGKQIDVIIQALPVILDKSYEDIVEKFNIFFKKNV